MKSDGHTLDLFGGAVEEPAEVAPRIEPAPDGPLIDDAYHSVVPDYVATLERMRDLPVSIVHGGHFPSFGPTRYRQLIDEYLASKRKPGCHLRAGPPQVRGRPARRNAPPLPPRFRIQLRRRRFCVRSPACANPSLNERQ